MSIFRVILAIIFPPLAVIDKGVGSIIITFLLTICGWVPGVIAALVILNKRESDWMCDRRMDWERRSY